MITEKQMAELTHSISHRIFRDYGIDARDVTQQAALMVLQCGKELCPQTVWGFSRNVLRHEIEKRQGWGRNERNVPVPDYLYATPGGDGDLSPFNGHERETIRKLLRHADRARYGLGGHGKGRDRQRKRWPGFVLAYLESVRQDDARRSVARKTSTIQPREDR